MMDAPGSCRGVHHSAHSNRTSRSRPPPLTQGILDPALELAKLEKKKGEAAGRADALRAKMALPSYQEKSPAAVKVRAGARPAGAAPGPPPGCCRSRMRPSRQLPPAALKL
jgi:hypothetical protein